MEQKATISIIRVLKDMSPFKKKLICGYLACVVGSFATTAYANGKEKLIKFRSHSEYTPSNEWLVVKNACKENWFDNFCTSAFFPIKIVNSLLPSIILWANPKKNE